jgi:hypothetical protein
MIRDKVRLHLLDDRADYKSGTVVWERDEVADQPPIRAARSGMAHLAQARASLMLVRLLKLFLVALGLRCSVSDGRSKAVDLPAVILLASARRWCCAWMWRCSCASMLRPGHAPVSHDAATVRGDGAMAIWAAGTGLHGWRGETLVSVAAWRYLLRRGGATPVGLSRDGAAAARDGA